MKLWPRSETQFHMPQKSMVVCIIDQTNSNMLDVILSPFHLETALVKTIFFIVPMGLLFEAFMCILLYGLSLIGHLWWKESLLLQPFPLYDPKGLFIVCETTTFNLFSCKCTF